MPDGIWSGLIGALITLVGAFWVHFSFVRPEHEKQLRLARKQDRRKRKRADRQGPELLRRAAVIESVSRDVDSIANAAKASAVELSELSRDIETHDAWLRLARVSRELPKQIRRVLLNTIRTRTRDKVALYQDVRECLELPEVAPGEADRWAELSNVERQSIVMRQALEVTHASHIADLLQLGALGMSGPLVQSELTDYTISDEEVEAYILDWVRQETTSDFSERALREAEDPSFAEAVATSIQ